MTLFSSSLESHMKKYMADVQLQAMNEQYHQAQLLLLQQAELMGLTPREAMNKLSTMPQFKTDAPEKPIVEDVYKALTASDYENLIRKKPAFKVENRNKINAELLSGVKLRKTPMKNKVKKVSPLQIEIEDAVRKRLDSANQSSQATTASTTNSPTSQSLPRNNAMAATQELKKLYKEKGKTWPYTPKTILTVQQVNEDTSKLTGSGIKKSKHKYKRGKK